MFEPEIFWPILIVIGVGAMAFWLIARGSKKPPH